MAESAALTALGWFLLCIYVPVVAVGTIWFFLRRRMFPIAGRFPLLVVSRCAPACFTFMFAAGAGRLVRHIRNGSLFVSLIQAESPRCEQMAIAVALGELFPAKVPCAIVFDVLFFGFIAGLWTRPMRNLGLLFQFEIAKALLESEQLRASGNASAAQNVANNPYLRYKELVSPRAQRYYVSVCVLLGLLFVAATAPYANFPEGCDSSNAVSSLESAKSQS